jgi:nucleotide-binding universal stress UspA family protein
MSRPLRATSRETIAKEEEMHDRPLLICYDGSESARRAIDAAAALLVPRRAVVLDVGSPLTPEESLAALSPAGAVGWFEETNAAVAADRAAEGAALARSAGFDAEARSELAAPTWEAVVELANEIDAAAIVMGTRGLTGARELLEGSLSHDVAHHAGRPVLVVPAPR